MKTLRTNVLYLLTLFCLNSCNGQGQISENRNSQNDDVNSRLAFDSVSPLVIVPNCIYLPAGNASTIDLTPHELSVAKANQEKQVFLGNFNSINPTPLTINVFNANPIETIHKDAFCIAAFTNICQTCKANCVKPIPALRIHFGLTADGSTFKFLYQALCLSQHSLDVAGKTVTYTVVNENMPYYKYNGGTNSFVPATVNDKKWIDNYKKLIRICKTSTCTTQEKYLEGVDTKSVVFSLHEIGSLIFDNTVESIQIYNANIDTTIAGVTYNYHSIIIGPYGLPLTKKLLSFKNKYANLSHMCPPSCNYLRYKTN